MLKSTSSHFQWQKTHSFATVVTKTTLRIWDWCIMVCMYMTPGKESRHAMACKHMPPGGKGLTQFSFSEPLATHTHGMVLLQG